MTDSRGSGFSGRIEIVQVWRLIAASLVVVVHAYSRIERTFPAAAAGTTLFAPLWPRSLGHLGVDFFFVLSGFIMVWTNWGRFGTPAIAWHFLRRRIERIAPLYWAATTLAVVLIARVPGLFSYGQRLDWGWIVRSYLFVPTISPGGELFSPVVGLGWTLNFEMYFYLLFAVALLASRRVGLLALSTIMIVVPAVGSCIQWTSPIAVQASSWLCVEFVLGMMIATAIKRGHVMSVRSASALYVVSAFIIAASAVTDPLHHSFVGLHFSRVIYWGLPCAGLLLATLCLPHRWLNRWFGRQLVEMGNGSYSIYLTQVFALPALAFALRAAGAAKQLSADVMIISVTTGTIAAGYAVYRIIEQPLAGLVRRWFETAETAT